MWIALAWALLSAAVIFLGYLAESKELIGAGAVMAIITCVFV